MPDHVIDLENRVIALARKVSGAGFVKVFGKDSLRSVYGQWLHYELERRTIAMTYKGKFSNYR